MKRNINTAEQQPNTKSLLEWSQTEFVFCDDIISNMARVGFPQVRLFVCSFVSALNVIYSADNR